MVAMGAGVLPHRASGSPHRSSSSAGAHPLAFWLWNVSLRHLILMLLVVLIVTPITTHYYLSTLWEAGRGDAGGDGDGGAYRSRVKLDHTEEITGSRVADLKVITQP